jgi:hypothetical protein
MNENDLRDCFAMFAMMSRGFKDNKEFDAKMCYEIADAMLEARNKEVEPEIGIVAVKSRRKKSD